ncbi:MAG: glycoside hydrolase N-terminal domain-containing protein [Candidatus Symbiothrix sp.]|nr:glycoside hydrolase N-terminal domain-containing protein [Candidatus Symbiothrix sp.]
MKLQYDFPAGEWEAEALPLGNGNIGAMVFGDVATDVIQINEHSLWSGGPGKNPNYNGGHAHTAAMVKQNLQSARTALQEKMTLFTENNSAYIDAAGKVVATNYPAENATLKSYINNLMGDKTDFGAYQSLSNLNISYTSVTIPEIVNISGDCNNPNNAGEQFPALFDNSLNTKWYADAGFKGFPCYITWEYKDAFPVSAYTLTSGGDMQARDPKSWNLYGSNDGNAYTLIETRTNVTFPERTQSLQFNLAQTVTYKYFKFEITSSFTANTSPQLSEIALENANIAGFPVYTNYSRELDVDNAAASVSYTMDGTNYTRDYFISYPDKVMVIRLAADKPGALSRNIWLTTPQAAGTISVENGVITLQGRPSDQTANGLKFAQEVKVIPAGGTMTVSGNKITVENANEILILSSAATNYQQCMDATFNYFSATSPLTTVQGIINQAVPKTYAQLLANHTTDYKALYDRMSLSLTNALNTNNKTTNQLLAGYKNNTNTTAENLYLEQLYYQYGRYLLISSSRKNGLPANLQGIWAEGLAPPWSADYHTNINLQMNYWLAEQTNLAECHWPVFEYVKSLVPRGKYTAGYYYCKPDGSPVRGWVIHHENNVWGNTGPGTWYEGFYFPAGAAWMCQDIWEYYQFNQDKAFLEEYYPILLDAALFWVDNLWRDSRDGTLVANPSYSPEHGPYSLGASCDQAIITELFDMVIKASKALNKNTPELNEIKAAKGRLAGPQIGLAGQFMEWKDELQIDITGDGGHRHANHLFWLHPGSQIVAGKSPQDDLYVEAMKKTLNTRGDGGTGWSKAWKINFWARLRDGNHSHKMLEELLKESTLTNLFDTHPPFQIDGNFGATAGMTEMLVQSQGESIELLPALPDTWNAGSFDGLKVRGNFEISANWSDKTLGSVKIVSNSGQNCKVKYPGIKNYAVAKGTGEIITPVIIDDHTISFETTAGTTYIIGTKLD